MADKHDQSSSKTPASAKADGASDASSKDKPSREDRLAQQLRANLAKRKAQSRARRDGGAFDTQ